MGAADDLIKTLAKALAAQRDAAVRERDEALADAEQNGHMQEQWAATAAKATNEVLRLRSQLAVAIEALRYYSGLRIEVIRACSGGVSEVPHRVVLSDTAIAALAKLEGEK
jgi:uncharacterized protein (DUF3084 family)